LSRRVDGRRAARSTVAWVAVACGRERGRRAARSAGAWVVVAAGMVLTGFGLAPALAEPADGGATTATGLASSSTTTTTLASAGTTQATLATSTSTSTSTSLAGSSTTTTPVRSSPPTSEPAGSGETSSTTSESSDPATSDPAGSELASSTREPVSSTTTTATSTATATAAAPAGGTLSVSAPDLLHLGSATSDGGVISARMGTVAVTDTRGVVGGAWTVRVSATPFTTGRGAAGQRIDPSSIAYWSGPAVARSGVAALVPGQPGPSRAVPLTTTRTAFSATGVAGDNTAAWNPTVVIRVPEAAVAGRYRGSIIHSVA
jgi:hypothetical protein